MRAKPKSRAPRVLLGVLDTSGLFGSIVEGLREIGCSAELLHLGQAKSLNWCPDTLPFFPRQFYRAYHEFWDTRELSRWSITRYLVTAKLLVSKAALIAWIAARIDALILKSGESLTQSHIDLALFRFLGKRIVFLYQGSDSRPPYLVGMDCTDLDVAELYRRTQETYARLKKSEKWADVVIANPLSAHFHSGKVCLGQIIGVTLDKKKGEPGLRLLTNSHDGSDAVVEKPIRILHAPSHTQLKGTDRVRKAIETLKDRGHSIDYIEITGKPNPVVMEELAKCDLVVDQLFSDSHAGVFGIEACIFGRPTIAAGYGAPELERLLPTSGVVPTEFCHPDALLPTLERLVSDPKYRLEVAERTRAYIETCAPAAVARRYLQLIEGTAPSDWFFEAADIRYVAGVAGPIENVRTRIGALLQAYGPDALCLDDKPQLRKAILDFATAQGDRDDEIDTAPTPTGRSCLPKAQDAISRG